MRTRLFAVVLIVAVAVMAAAIASRSATTTPCGTSHERLSVVALETDAAAALKAKGVSPRNDFADKVNRGRKFNPTGGLIPIIPTAGEAQVIVLLVDFATLPPGGPAARLDPSYFDDMLFGTVYDPPEYAPYPGHPTDRTLASYIDQVSYGNVSIVTVDLPSATGWKNSGMPYDYYCDDDGVHDYGYGPYPNNAQGLVIDAVKAADPLVDFSQYAVDGEVPVLFVVHAGTGAEWSAQPDIIWSHSWDVSEGTGLDGFEVDGVKVNNYAMMPEVGGDLTGFTGVASGPYPPTVGVYAHELGHVAGLPDQYDYGYESEGTGNYSLMAGGSWNRYPVDRIFSGNSPAHMDAWSKAQLGFVDPIEITASTNVVLPPAEISPVVYKMVVPNSGGREYFLFENRQWVGFDQGLLDRRVSPAARLHGLAVYHVDDAVFTLEYWRPNEAENWKEFRSEGWRKAWTGATHYAISLLQADDRWDLERGVNGGDPGDLYPGSTGATSLGSTTRPNTSSYYFWLGSTPKFGYSGVTASNITEDVGGNVSLTLSFVPYK